MRGKWLINVSENSGMINATLNNEKSLKQIFIRYKSWFFVFQATRKSLKYVKFKLIPNQHLFYARSRIKDGESRIC